MAQTEPGRRVCRAAAIRCTCCGEVISPTMFPVVAEGFVFHAACYDGQEGGRCCECGYPFISPRPERTPSCRCSWGEV